jgi:hypothetical protein
MTPLAPRHWIPGATKKRPRPSGEAVRAKVLEGAESRVTNGCLEYWPYCDRLSCLKSAEHRFGQPNHRRAPRQRRQDNAYQDQR